MEASTPALDDIFLHVIYPCDSDVTEMPDTRLIESENAVGAEIVNDRIILFGRSELTNIDSLTYTPAPEDTSSIHTICNLIPNTTYHVYRLGGTIYARRSGLPAPPGAEEFVLPAPTTTDAGILAFNFSGSSLYLQVSNVHRVYSESPFSVTITWDTDIPSDSQVEYGTTPGYGSFAPLDPALVTEHSVTLTDPDVLRNTKYYFRVHSNGSGGGGRSPGGGALLLPVGRR